jgi:hypothetical protein
MSGGSFNYVCFKLDGDGSDVAQSLPDLRDMEQCLRDLGKHEAANEILRGIIKIETAINRLTVVGSHLAPLAKAAEWWQSGDTDEDDFGAVFNEKYLGGNDHD